MARKRFRDEDEGARQSRKDILLARREARQMRQVRLAIAGVGGLLLIVLIVALVNEFFITPRRAVAVVRGEEITFGDWEDRVRYERAQRIVALEDQYEAFGGDLNIIYQIGGIQVINELLSPDVLGQNVLDLMVDEAVIRQEAEIRGIRVTDADVDARLGESFNYFNGASPTSTPLPTATVMPTPSLTPIPTPVITEVVPTAVPPATATLGPTVLPPTPTAVSREEFEARLEETVSSFTDLGIDEAQFREVVRAQIYRERLDEALASESELSTEAEQVSFYLLTFSEEAAANEALAMAQQDGFLAVWNAIRSEPPDNDPELEAVRLASELLWRTRESVESGLGNEVAEAAFSLSPGTPSQVISRELDEATMRYYVFQVSGREVRELPQATIQQNEAQFLANYVDQKLVGNLETDDFWRERVPTVPRLDRKFLEPPEQPEPNLPDQEPDS